MLVVWRFYDGKPGHDRQSFGLVQALASAASVETVDFDVRDRRRSFLQFVTGHLDFGEHTRAPDLLVGAGRRCQWPMLAAKRARGGNTIYLMKPHLPSRWFNLCVVPKHDRPKTSSRLIATDGVLNDISVSPTKGDEGLLLIGGPSDHYAWDSEQLMRQIQSILAANSEKKWVIADSRRTPPETSAALQRLARNNVAMVEHQRSAPDALIKQFARSEIVWVSCDSVSMIYEALTAGAAVGVLAVPTKGRDRITRIVQDLVTRKIVTTHADWQAGAELPVPVRLAEATRCAAIILSRWDPKARKIKAEI